jgi:hypothetical protein
VSKLHGPFVSYLIEKTSFPQLALLELCHKGFPYVGEMPHYELDVADKSKHEATITVEELWEGRTSSNQDIIKSLKPSGDPQEFRMKTCEEANSGCNSYPVTLGPVHLESGPFSRRFGVTQTKETVDENGNTFEVEALRTVDHETECGKNLSVKSTQTTIHATVDYMMAMLQFLLQFFSPLMWKQDIKGAFRTLPIRHDQLQFGWFAYWHQHKIWTAQHKCFNFGCTSSVRGWDLSGAFITWVLQTDAMVAV